MTLRELLRPDLAVSLTKRGWLSRTPADFQKAVLANCIVQRRDAGDPLYYSGDEIGGMFGIIDGTIEIVSGYGNLDAFIIHLAQAGFWVGEGSVLTGTPRKVTASARTDATVGYLSLAALRSIVGINAEYWRYFGMLAVEHNNLATGGGSDLMIRDVERRCVAVLLRIAGCRYNSNDCDVHPEALVTQEELAAMSNLSRKAVGDILRKLEAQCHIALGYRSIAIYAPAKLRALIIED